jgi:hypothetical protein
MRNVIFILSHYDDEFGLFNVIEDFCKKNDKVFIIYLTNGLTIDLAKNKKKMQRRENESIRILLKLGVKKNNILFLGKKLKIPVYHLHKNLNLVYDHISEFLKKFKGLTYVYTHAWEGGNEDHDSSFVITKKILINNKKLIKAFQFAQYSGHDVIFYPFKIQTFIRTKSKIFKVQYGLLSKIKYITYLFNYTSQFYLWLPIYPFIIFKILFNSYGNVQLISKSITLSRPHSGLLLYEKFRQNKYRNLKILFSNFLAKSK